MCLDHSGRRDAGHGDLGEAKQDPPRSISPALFCSFFDSSCRLIDNIGSFRYSLHIPAAGGNATLTAETVTRPTIPHESFDSVISSRLRATHSRSQVFQVYGAIRGLETFSQMLQPDLTMREQSVEDWPRFPFRAVLIDSGRYCAASAGCAVLPHP